MYRKSYQYSYIILYHFVKSWNAAQSFRDLFLAKEKSAKAHFSDDTHHIAFLQWTPFGISLGETAGETETFFLLMFLKRSHASSPVTRFFRNGVCSFLCIKSAKIQTGFVVVGEFVDDPSSQFTYFFEIFKTTNDGLMVHIVISGQHSGCQAFVHPLPRLPKVPGRRNFMIDLF